MHANTHPIKGKQRQRKWTDAFSARRGGGGPSDKRKAMRVPMGLSVIFSIVVLAQLAAAGSPPGDSDIRRSVRRYITTETSIAPENLEIHVKDGIVVLSGTVSNLLQQDQAGRIAESVRGVRSVVDNTRVQPVVRDDGAIARDVRAALPRLSSDRKAEINVDVSGGVVTLEGTADSWVLSRLAVRRAMSVRGVTKIVNRIDVSPGLHRSDEAIDADIERRLFADLHVDASNVEVAVRNGRVTLSGTVTTAAEKRRAAENAWIAGVVSVDDRQLRVKWPDETQMKRASPYIHLSDPEILRAVKDALRMDPRITAANPVVSVDNGAVRLSGVVDTLYAKRAAEADALNTTGVWKVDNQLELRYRAFPPDQDVARMIRDVFRRDAELHARNIQIAVKDNHIRLSGSIPTMGQKVRAENIAAQIEGVLTLDNQIRVDAPEKKASDADLKAAIQDELFWSPYVDSDRITVTVAGGQAVLTGRATDRFAARIAVLNAFEGGARSVRARLAMETGETFVHGYEHRPASAGPATVFWLRE